MSVKNVLILVPKYITKYLVLEGKYIACTSRIVKNMYLIFYFFSYLFFHLEQYALEYKYKNNSIVKRKTNVFYLVVSI